LVALALIPEAATTMPGIFTNRDTTSDLISLKEAGLASDDRNICMSSTFSSPSGLGAVTSLATYFAASSNTGR
jgi:hypothetical protein